MKKTQLARGRKTRKVGKESRRLKGKQEGREKIATTKGRSRNGRAMKEVAITMFTKKVD